MIKKNHASKSKDSWNTWDFGGRTTSIFTPHQTGLECKRIVFIHNLLYFFSIDWFTSIGS